MCLRNIKNNPSEILVAVILVVVIMAPTRLTASDKNETSRESRGNSSVAVLSDEIIIAERDISDWQSSQACYGKTALTSRKAAFIRQLETEIFEEIYRTKTNKKISAEDYEKEAERIDAETRAPQVLACIKSHFGKDRERYYKVFIKPTLVSRYLRDYVKTDATVQAMAYRSRDMVMKDINEKDFRNIAVEAGIKYSTAEYSLAADVAIEAKTPFVSPWSLFETAFIEKYLKDLKVGQTRREPIEDERTICFVRLTGVAGEKYRFEELTIDKLSFEGYLKTLKKISCAIKDESLKNWTKGIKGNPVLWVLDIH